MMLTVEDVLRMVVSGETTQEEAAKLIKAYLPWEPIISATKAESRLAAHAEREGAEYWVIEKSGNPAFYWKITHREKGQTKYYRGCWVGDVQLATMFSHKETAEEEMQFMLNNSDERGLRVCGHTNVGPSPAGPDALAEALDEIPHDADCPGGEYPPQGKRGNCICYRAGVLAAIGAALHSRPAQRDVVYTKADMEAACEIVRAANRKVEKIRLGKMVDRFLAWRLPADFSPDAGISFKPNFNEHTAHPMKHEPIGTNLFTAEQAEKMLRHVLEWDAAIDAAMSQQEKRDG